MAEFSTNEALAHLRNTLRDQRTLIFMLGDALEDLHLAQHTLPTGQPCTCSMCNNIRATTPALEALRSYITLNP